MDAGKYNIYADFGKNRLYFSLQAFFTNDLIKEIACEVQKPSPEFSIIDNISEFKPALPEGTVQIKGAQVAVIPSGVKRIIPVITGKSIPTKMQFDPDAACTSSAADAEIIPDDNRGTFLFINQINN